MASQTRVDPEPLNRLIFETLLTEISARFVRVAAEEVDAEIESAQKGICECLCLEHSSLWQSSPDDPGKIRMTHIYRAPDLTPPMEDMDGADYFPWVLSKLGRNELVCLSDVYDAPPEAARDKESWRYFQIKSTLAIPLLVGGGPVLGCLSFEATRRCREWPESLVSRLQVIAQVFANALQRKVAETKLRDNEARLTLAAQAAKAGLWTVNPKTGEMWATNVTRELLGLSPDAPLSYAIFLRAVLPRDRARVRKAADQTLRSGKEGSVEYRVPLPRGNVKWLAAHGRQHPVNPELLMGVVTDITESRRLQQERDDLAGRLLDAQDMESARIARELHDDIGQSMALFNMQFGKLNSVIPKPSPEAATACEELRQRLNEITRRISVLSHRLHSSELDYLGLAAAVHALCREIVEQHDVKATSTCGVAKGVLAREVEICIYRIIQEALSNAVRHGQPRSIEVSIAMRGSTVSCRVADDGMGFETADLKGRRGLGLISMKERARLLGGECTVTSSAGHGTAVECKVPNARQKQQQRRKKEEAAVAASSE